MAKDNKYFILRFKLKTEPWQEDIIDKRIEAGRKVYNQMVSESLKYWYELKKSKQYRALLKSLTGDKKKDKTIWKEISKLRTDAGLSKFGLKNLATKCYKYYKHLIGSHVAQALADNLWNAYEDLFFRDGKKILYRKYGQCNSLETNHNGTTLRFKPELRQLEWSKLRIPVIVDENNTYEVESLVMPIAYCRILRKFIKGKRKFYLQVVFTGSKTFKRRKSDGSFVHKLGKGDVGIDIGVSTVAYASESEVRIQELADKAQGYERERVLLQRKLDRSQRAMNVDNYNPDGTIKKGHRRWVRSKRYVKTLMRIKEIYRKQAAMRKLQHELLANHVLALGDRFLVEEMNFKKLQKRARKNESSGKENKPKRKKCFGKSLANRGPAMFISILRRKLSYFGKELIKINTREAKASQFNHVTKEYHKKMLSERWNLIEGKKIQRDMYSAFLIMNINNDLKTFNLEKCNNRYENFIILHDKEVKRLTNQSNPSCLGI